MKAIQSRLFSVSAKCLLIILGTLFLAGLIRKVGWNQLLAELKLIGWGLIPYVCIHAFQEVLTTFAWQATFPDRRLCPWWRLYLIIWAGSAVNNIYHTGILGEEATKVALVRKEVSTQAGIASVLIAKLAEAFAQMLFILGGFVLVLEVLRLPRAFELAMSLTFTLLAVGVLVFWILQRKGLLSSLISPLEKTFLPIHWSKKLKEKTRLLDDSIRIYHRSQIRPFWWAVGLHLIRLFLNVAQTQLVLSLMGAPGGLRASFCIAVFSALVNGVFFFIPGRLGAREGGKLFIARALGMTSAQGLTLGIVSRLNQIIWSVMGLGVLFLWQPILQDKGSVKEGEPA